MRSEPLRRQLDSKTIAGEEIDMKRIFLSTLIGASVVAMIFIFSVSAAARPLEDYPLVCRGGGSLVTGIAPGERNIGFTFVRGTKPAGEGLAPGETSWEEHSMDPTEHDISSLLLQEQFIIFKI